MAGKKVQVDAPRIQIPAHLLQREKGEYERKGPRSAEPSFLTFSSPRNFFRPEFVLDPLAPVLCGVLSQNQHYNLLKSKKSGSTSWRLAGGPFLIVVTHTRGAPQKE